MKENDGCSCEEHGEPRQVNEAFCFKSTVCAQHVYKTMCDSILGGGGRSYVTSTPRAQE